jgi:CMP-2-keto-3-deoxyoctulosonic acid synthetase
LERGVKIRVVEAASVSIGVDTLEDLERVRAIVESAGAHASGVPS